MKYITIKTAHIFRPDKSGVLHRAKGVVNKGAILVGNIINKQVVTHKGTRTESFLESISPNFGAIYIHSGTVKAYGEEMSSFSGQQIVEKVGGVDVLVPTGVFAGLGFVVGSILGENKLALTISGAVVGSLIGFASHPSEQKLSADGGRRVGKPRGGSGGHVATKQICKHYNSDNECTKCGDPDDPSTNHNVPAGTDCSKL